MRLNEAISIDDGSSVDSSRSVLEESVRSIPDNVKRARIEMYTKGKSKIFLYGDGSLIELTIIEPKEPTKRVVLRANQTAKLKSHLDGYKKESNRKTIAYEVMTLATIVGGVGAMGVFLTWYAKLWKTVMNDLGYTNPAIFIGDMMKGAALKISDLVTSLI